MKHQFQTEMSRHLCTCGVRLHSERERLNHLIERLDAAEEELENLRDQ